MPRTGVDSLVMMFFHSAILTMAISLPALPATVVVAEKTSKRVILGTDSMFLGLDQKHHQISGTTCKLGHTRRIAFALTSNVSFDGKTGFDEMRLAASAVAGSDTVRESVGRFATSIVGLLNKAVADAQNNYPAVFSRIRRYGVTAVAFAGFEGSYPVLCAVKVTLEDKIDGGWSLKIETEGNCKPNLKTELMFLGSTDGTEHFYETHPGFIHKTPPSEAVRKLIAAGIAGAPDFAAPPISIGEVNASGFRFVVSGPCRN